MKLVKCSFLWLLIKIHRPLVLSKKTRYTYYTRDIRLNNHSLEIQIYNHMVNEYQWCPYENFIFLHY